MSRRVYYAASLTGMLALAASFGWQATAGQAAEKSAKTVAVSSAPSSSESPVEISIHGGAGAGAAIQMRGREARQQLVVTGKLAGGAQRDVTRLVKYTVEPPGIVSIDATGLLRPLADGKVTITAATGNVKAQTQLEVHDFANQKPINFANQIVPIFTKFSCNSGGCHGKSSGQNGFKLSLLGFEPREDYEHLVMEGRGRRAFPAAPDQSLLLLKPINAVPHGGGHRIEAESHEYHLLRNWIAQGLPMGKDTDAKVMKISVFPSDRTMNRRSQQQIIVLAHYSDNTIEDVTRLAQFDVNHPEMAEVTPAGLVTTLDLAGDVGVMARYLGQVGVFRASIPLGSDRIHTPQPANFIDQLVFEKLKTLGVPPSPACDDATFLRRATIDIAGRIPTAEEAKTFLADKDAAKRDKLIDRLLDSSDYADYFANKWSAILRNRRLNASYQHGTYIFHDWVRECFYNNKPYDQFVREILTATGEISDNPPVAWFRAVGNPTDEVESSSQLFLGLRMQCAECHHHPFEKWSQRDYYSFSAFFMQVGRKDGRNFNERIVYHKRGQAVASHPNTGETLKPAGLGAEPIDIPADQDPRQALANWMTAKDNPYFARALVNRYWKHFFGIGIIDPEDDMRETNPASNPALLAALADHFVTHNFDLKDLVRTICRSQAYQLSSEPFGDNLSDKQNFSRYYPRRLSAEVLLDGLDAVSGTKTKFNGLPRDTKAVQLPDGSFDSYFLSVFGRPEAASACECERSGESNLPQSLHMLNSNDIQGKLADANGRAAKLAKDTERSAEDKVRDIYLSVFAREPKPKELTVALEHIRGAGDKEKEKQSAYEDLIWALVNTKEFLLNH